MEKIMSTIKIQNIGPIKDVVLELNKVNVLMGPQSSGKSTIAKVISYCQWLEKRYILDGECDDEFKEKFMNFHRISKTYLSKNTLIDYKSDSIHITYKGLSYKAKIKQLNSGQKFINSKNIYIPAERNFVSVIPNLGKYKDTNDNIMNFLYDWYEAKKKYKKGKELSLLNLQASYYHIQDTDTDKLILHNKKELSLNNASSGLQSVLPMVLLIDFLTDGLYKEKMVESVAEKNINNEIFKVAAKYFNSKKEKEKIPDKINYYKLLINEINLKAQRSSYHFSQFIIEEPEQNLFPQAQRDLVYYMIRAINDKKRDHKLLITTHSPYILYALNNCMMGHLIKDTMPEEEQDELASKSAWIDPKLVSIWEIDADKGTINPIKNSETNTVSNHYFNEIMNKTMDEYYEMLNYLEI